jgi:pilus assembly protein FimV
MRLNTRSKITSFALKTLSGAVASAVFLSSSAYAAGLGKLTVLSSLGQPLSAEIELTAVSTEEAAGLVAKLAPVDAFRVANIDFNPALLSLRFAVEQRGSRQFVKITSTQPVNEPFVDMLLELSWNTGKLVREYTFLLDPAEMRTTQSAQVSAPVDVLSQGARSNGKAAASKPAPAQPSQAASTPAPTPSSTPAPAPAADRAQNASEYKVKAGDTLGKIAAQLKPVEVSLDMMLVALYRANPDAFAGNNMNRLKSGQILAVPDSGAIKGTGEGEARGVVVAHAADFNAYRNKLAGQVATSSPDKAPTASQSTGGKITAKVEDRRATSEAKDQLKLTKADAKTSAANAEERVAREKALADANARVKELERNVSELEKLMVVRNKAAADAQKAAPALPQKAASVPAPVVPAPAPVVSAKPAPVPAVPAIAPAPVVAPVPVPAPVPAPVVASAPVPAEVPPVASAPAPIAKPAAKIAVVKKAEAPSEPGILDLLMDNLIAIGAAVLAIGGLAAFAIMRRNKGDGSLAHEPSILGAPTDQAHSLFAETGGQSVDTSNSVFNSSFAPSASQLDTNEVDPVAEADVYIAYGRDAQAEEILKEALRTHPERYPVRLKLLEIYAARKDLRSFETQATDMYSMTKGQGDEWAQVAALGLAIDPVNPLYAGAASAGPATIIPAAQAEPVLLAKKAVVEDVSTDLDLSDMTALPVAEQVATPAKPAEDHTLDFDLGGLSFEPVAPQAAPAAAADMDFSLPGTAVPAAAPAPAKAEESIDMAFNMDFDAPAAPAANAEHAKALDDIDLDLASNDFTAEYAASGKNDLSGMGDLASAFNIPSAPAPAPAASPSMDLDAMNFDLPSAPATASAATPQFDMTGIDLDLPPMDNADHFANTMVMETGDQSAVHMEMETKLDLAIAYQEIGDKEGARELLDEVIKGGSGEQVGKAKEMRIKLA